VFDEQWYATNPEPQDLHVLTQHVQFTDAFGDCRPIEAFGRVVGSPAVAARVDSSVTPIAAAAVFPTVPRNFLRV